MKKIVVIGPESTGKSTLCKDLATHYNCDYLPEYARTYLEENGAEYNYEDVVKMVQGQFDSEIDFLEKCTAEFGIVDTDLLVYKVWIEEKYGVENEFVETVLKNQDTDHYLLCDIDLPWEFDELREHPNPEDRLRLFNRYEELLKQFNYSYSILEGGKEQRLKDAISILTNLI